MVAALAPQLHLLQSHIFALLLLDVFANHCFIAPHRRHKVASCPEMLPHKASLPLRVHPRQMDRALALDESHYLRHSILRWNRNEHVHVIGHHVSFENLTPVAVKLLLPPRQSPGEAHCRPSLCGREPASRCCQPSAPSPAEPGGLSL